MRFAPKTWTHHHLQRFYHLSMLSVWSMVIVVLVTGMLGILSGAKAETQSVSVGTSATVPEISPGPTTSGGGGGGGYPVPTTSPVKSIEFPQVTIKPDLSLGQVQGEPSKAGSLTQVFVFNTANPQFFGDTNIKNALIYIEIAGKTSLRSTTIVDGNMNWSWMSLDSLQPGWYTITVTAQDPQVPELKAAAALDFYIEKISPIPPISPVKKPISGNLFDVFLKIPDQYKTVMPGQQVVANINLIPAAPLPKPVDVEMEYIIQDKDGNVVIDTTETVQAQRAVSLIKIFYTNPETSVGEYYLIVKLPAQSVETLAYDNFNIKGKAVIPVAENATIDYTVLFQALLVLLLLFSLIAYFEYNKVSFLSGKIRKVNEEDLKPDLKPTGEDLPKQENSESQASNSENK